jgi:hypothetical protein
MLEKYNEENNKLIEKIHEISKNQFSSSAEGLN